MPFDMPPPFARDHFVGDAARATRPSDRRPLVFARVRAHVFVWGDTTAKDIPMRLLGAYTVIVFVMGFFAVQLGFQLDHISPLLAVPIALCLYFAVLIIGWPIAVFVTERWLMGKSAA
ncbi:MAG: hypothetical protein ACXWLO_05000 [Rhizomicrobium sp.]